ncbi:hypothetical protein B0H13DRAFT_2041997 [Mycena leptocephala]|nr:hypothetical protein B0H13DRAFT_2041997 [Mycena leptocephala]
MPLPKPPFSSRYFSPAVTSGDSSPNTHSTPSSCSPTDSCRSWRLRASRNGIHVQEPQSPSQAHCSSCAAASQRLASLSPCAHALCPACFASALNILDQSSMRCVVCCATVSTFGIVRSPIFMLPISPPSSPSAERDPVVLRIDNIPWDITPPAILTFLGVSSTSGAHAHVLLDRLGKTLSHAFVELPTEDVACSVLRSKHRTPVLGFGRRTRFVTLTRSSQSALMAALFPSWAGASDGSSSQLTDLGCLMCTPDAYFVKAPGLPFYALVSLLAKFPTCRVDLRDLLYDLTLTAIKQLRAHELGDEDPALVQQIVSTAHGCQVFTEQQLCRLSESNAQTPSNSDKRANADDDEFHAHYEQTQYSQSHLSKILQI